MTQFLNPTLYRRASNANIAITRNNVDSLLDAGMIEVRMSRDLSDGSPRYWRIRRNGKTQTWKRDANRVRIPYKYGMYGYGVITETDFVEG